MKSIIKKILIIFVVMLFVCITKSLGTYQFSRVTETCNKGHANCVVVHLSDGTGTIKVHFRDNAAKLLVGNAANGKDPKDDIEENKLITSNTGIFCLEHDKSIAQTGKVKLLHRINIDNSTITKYTYGVTGTAENPNPTSIVHKIGYRMGYLLAQSNKGGTGHYHSPVQFALWSVEANQEATGNDDLNHTVAYQFLSKLGLKDEFQNLGVHSMDEWVKNNPNRAPEAPIKVLSAATDYRDKRASYQTIAQGPTTPTVQVVGDNIIVGPLNVTYSNLVNAYDGEVIAGINSYGLTDINGNPINYAICTNNGRSLYRCCWNTKWNKLLFEIA